MAIEVKRYLDWFSKSDLGDTVTYRELVVVLEDGVEIARSYPDRYGSDAALVARAVADERNTWDEDDLCAEYGLERMPIPEEQIEETPPPPPEEEEPPPE